MSWVNLKVGEFTPFVYGKAIKKEDQLNTGYPVYGSNGIYAYSAKPLVGPYAVIVGRKGSVGKVHLSTQPCWVSDTAFYIQFDSLEDANFTYYLLSTLGLEDMNTDAAVPGLNRDNAHRLIIKVPNTVSQRSTLIRPLMLIDNKITLNRQINQTLEAMAQALFKSWFVDFEPVKAKMAALASGGNDEDANLAAMSAISSKTTEQLLVLKTDNPAQYQQLYDTAVLFPSEMVESELGEVPKGWEYGSVGEIAKAKGGYAFKSTDFSEQGFPVIKIKNITGNGIVEIEYNSCVVESATSKTARFRLNDGDLVMAMTGATVGKTGLINTFGNNIYLNQRVAVFESDTYGNKISWFLFCLFNTREAFQFVVGSALGSAQPNISSSGIEMTPTILPNSHVMECFLSKVDPLFNKWLKNNEESIFLSTLRDELLPKLLSGELLV